MANEGRSEAPRLSRRNMDLHLHRLSAAGDLDLVARERDADDRTVAERRRADPGGAPRAAPDHGSGDEGDEDGVRPREGGEDARDDLVRLLAGEPLPEVVPGEEVPRHGHDDAGPRVDPDDHLPRPLGLL